MNKDDRVYLDDILESIGHIENYIKNTDANTFNKEIQL
jgi:uncharacterized protein with HEPN domain